MIPDTNQSGVRDASVKDQRVILPKLLGSIWRILELMASGCGGIELMFLDFSDAFLQIPLHQDELRYFCTQVTLNGMLEFIVYLRIAQGSRGAPTSWARLAALVMRLTQSVLMDSVSLLCYVDDPLCAIRGGPVELKLIATAIMCIWVPWGFRFNSRTGSRHQGHMDRSGH